MDHALRKERLGRLGLFIKGKKTKNVETKVNQHSIDCS